MKISHDWSQVRETSRMLIQKGYACDDIHALRFQFIYTDEEKAEAIRYAASHNDEEQRIYRIHEASARSNAMAAIMEAIAEKFSCYQYQRDEAMHYDSKEWELFFWCNSFYSTLPGIEMPDRDYSYFTLTFNERHTVEERAEICRRVLEFIQTRYGENPNLDVTVQHSTWCDMSRIEADARIAQNRLKSCRCQYAGKDGKIVIIDGQPFFKPLYAKKRMYRLTATDIIQYSFRQAGSIDCDATLEGNKQTLEVNCGC